MALMGFLCLAGLSYCLALLPTTSCIVKIYIELSYGVEVPIRRFFVLMVRKSTLDVNFLLFKKLRLMTLLLGLRLFRGSDVRSLDRLLSFSFWKSMMTCCGTSILTLVAFFSVLVYSYCTERHEGNRSCSSNFDSSSSLIVGLTRLCATIVAPLFVIILYCSIAKLFVQASSLSMRYLIILVYFISNAKIMFLYFYRMLSYALDTDFFST